MCYLFNTTKTTVRTSFPLEARNLVLLLCLQV